MTTTVSFLKDANDANIVTQIPKNLSFNRFQFVLASVIFPEEETKTTIKQGFLYQSRVVARNS